MERTWNITHRIIVGRERAAGHLDRHHPELSWLPPSLSLRFRDSPTLRTRVRLALVFGGVCDDGERPIASGSLRCVANARAATSVPLAASALSRARLVVSHLLLVLSPSAHQKNPQCNYARMLSHILPTRKIFPRYRYTKAATAGNTTASAGTIPDIQIPPNLCAPNLPVAQIRYVNIQPPKKRQRNKSQHKLFSHRG